MTNYLWLEESNISWPHWQQKLAVSKVLHREQSAFQNIVVYDSERYGRILSLDGTVQCTEFDEAHYHEMMVHPIALTHPSPKKALVIGAGDGGIVRELCKHSSIDEIHFCELDGRVVAVCEEFIPSMACAVRDPRVKHAYEDGAAYVKQFNNYFDLIIVDSTDPVGPGEVLFTNEFYASLKNALTPNGLAATQAEGFLCGFDRGYISALLGRMKESFKYVGLRHVIVPTYPLGNIGISFLSNEFNPKNATIREEAMPSGLRFFTPEIHRATLALPAFAAGLVP